INEGYSAMKKYFPAIKEHSFEINKDLGIYYNISQPIQNNIQLTSSGGRIGYILPGSKTITKDLFFDILSKPESTIFIRNYNCFSQTQDVNLSTKNQIISLLR